MSRPRFAWSIFALCLLTTVSAVGWLTHSAWRADQARQQALLESEVQNALWRMDSLVAPLLAIESNRPALAASFEGTPRLPKKLVKGYVVREALGHWIIRRDGGRLDHEILSANSPLVAENWPARLKITDFVSSGPPAAASDELIVWPNAALMAQNAPRPQQVASGQQARDRTQLVQQVQQIAQTVQQPVQEIISTSPRLTPLQPMWVANELVLARRRQLPGKSRPIVIEICWLNWPEWESMLNAQLQGVSIPLKLQPSDHKSTRLAPGATPEWQMVSLPIRLEPLLNSLPVRWPWHLVAIWVLLLAVAVAFGWLMQQTLNLSERRAAFVSAVTHELRTPLTTFRLYTEMLSEGLATDPEQQHTYFQTLNREANRLTHLVENVLAFARLEHGRTTARNETVTVGDILNRCRPRLEQRVAETPLSLSFQISDAAQGAKLTTNPMAVEQILFNLIDNSCKYARDATDPRILCDIGIDRGQVLIRISDFGPGLSPAARRTLFLPFQKSSSQAAETAPGIGLGLALSQRLARDLQGSLVCTPNTPTGLCFEVRLPLSAS